ncbi:hypothetical protein KBD08_00390 [Candidatus Babeliales bacterium]|nr:hypothetical protein [Candidatus Babeliales bacterium]
MRVLIFSVLFLFQGAMFASLGQNCWGVPRFTVETEHGEALFRQVKHWEYEYVGRNYQGGGLIKQRYVALQAFFPLSKKPLLVIQHEESEFSRTYFFKGMTVLGLYSGDCQDWSLKDLQDRLRMRQVYFETNHEVGPLKPTVAYLIINNDY